MSHFTKMKAITTKGMQAVKLWQSVCGKEKIFLVTNWKQDLGAKTIGQQ